MVHCISFAHYYLCGQAIDNKIQWLAYACEKNQYESDATEYSRFFQNFSCFYSID